MNYDDLSHDEAANRLREHNEADWSGRIGNEVIEPRDVLYWLDAFGNLDLAINCQGLPKDLPDAVVLSINRWDALNDWHGTVEEHECPTCGRELYDFDWKDGNLLVDEYGNHQESYEVLSDPAGYFWNVAGDERVMCHRCREAPPFHGWQPEPSSNSIRVFYGESDEFSRFSHGSGVIRWDFLWDSDHDSSTDLYNLMERDGDELIEGQEIAASFAKGRSDRDEMMERIGFERIHVNEIDQRVKGMRQFWRYAKEVLEGWATLDSKTMVNEPTHPDLNFTYIIEGEHAAWVHSDNMEKFEAEVVWQVYREAGDYERAGKWYDDHEDLLSFDWQTA